MQKPALINQTTVTRLLAAAASGLMLTCAFPKVEAWALAWIAVVPLMIALQDVKTGERFRIGFVAGLVHFMTLLYWVVPTMVIYGDVPVFLAVPVLFLFSSCLALFPAVFSVLIVPLTPRPYLFMITLPALWTSTEFLRTHLFTGFPWALAGYSQYRLLPLIQIADITGVYGVSFLVMMSNAAVLILLLVFFKNRSGKTAGSTISGLIAVFVLAVAVGAVWLYGEQRVRTVEKAISNSPKYRIAAIQGNIDQAVKWDPAFQKQTTETYLHLSKQAAAEKSSLIVWPETATPFYFLIDRPLTQRVVNGIREMKADFIIGSNAVQANAKGEASFFNSAWLMNAEGAPIGRYDKVHLVPFGEYVPLKRILFFIGKMVAHVGEFTPGKKGGLLTWKNERIGIQICYEIIFPALARKAAANGATLLVNMTNDAWYGKTSAPYQHFIMSIFRAVENRRALVRSANTGISGFVDPTGKILGATGLFEEAAPVRSVPAMRMASTYTRIGDTFAATCLAGMLLMAIGQFLQYRRRKRNR